MDPFATIVFSGIVLTFLTFLLLGWRSRVRTRDITNKDEYEAWAARARIEEREVPEMVEGQNALRRKHGRREITEQEIRSRVGGEQAAALDQADAEVKAREVAR
jgi:hypothetical protein